MTVFITVAAAIVGAMLFAFLIIFGMFFNLWLNAKAAGVPLSVTHMAVMRLRKVDPRLILDAAIRLWKAGDPVPISDLEAHVLAGGDLEAVTEGLIAAQKAGLDVDFRTVAAISLAGRDVVDAVKTRVNPKVVVVPGPRSGLSAIAGVAQDGIRVAARARVTVRTQLDRLVGGAGEETISARVGEGIVAAIGRALRHREILEKPELIAEYLLEKGLDSGTSYEILSIDIADVDVMDNVAARLDSARAEADKRIARAKAEVRRAAAVASHQEMKARTTESESRVTAARATEPLAVSSAFEEANMGRIRPLPPTADARLRWRIAQ